MMTVKTKLLALLLAGVTVCLPVLASCDTVSDEPDVTVDEIVTETERMTDEETAVEGRDPFQENTGNETEQPAEESEEEGRDPFQENTEQETEQTTEESEGKYTYTVIVKDQYGDPVEGVAVSLASDNGPKLPAYTDANGVVVFTFYPDRYCVYIWECPDGYNADPEQAFYFESDSTELTVTITKGEQIEEPAYSEGLEYVSNGDGTCYVSGIGNCVDSDIVIPSVSPDGDRVTGIGEDAFSMCDMPLRLTSITIPDCVTNIMEWAFSDCYGLKKIIVSEGNPVYHSSGNCVIETASKTLILGCCESMIPSDGTVTSIGMGAFCGSDLTEIIIPDSVTSIGEGAFANCYELVSVTMGNGVINIGPDAFTDCWNLSNIVWSKQLKTIGEFAFMSCVSIKSITLPEQLSYVDEFAFHECEGLESITISSSVTNIGEKAFGMCDRLTNVYFNGTEKQWAMLTIGEGNDDLLKATVQFLGKEEEPKEYTCFLQTDKKWSSVPFGYSSMTCDGLSHPAVIGDTLTYKCTNTEHKKWCEGTVSFGSGCGILAIKNAVYALNGMEVDVADLAQKAVEKGEGWRDSDGTHWAIVENFCDEYQKIYHVKYVSWETEFSEKITQHLLGSGTIVINIPKHFMCIADYDEAKDLYLVMDSAPTDYRGTKKGNGMRWCTEKELLAYNIQVFHLISSNN